MSKEKIKIEIVTSKSANLFNSYPDEKKHEFELDDSYDTRKLVELLTELCKTSIIINNMTYNMPIFVKREDDPKGFIKKDGAGTELNIDKYGINDG